MGRKSQLDLNEVETLAECVRKYPCLYDKSCKDYKDKNCVENAWAKVDKELGFEEGEAKNVFSNLKKRYSKKRNDLRKAKRSGASLADIQKFEKQLEPFSFLGWLNHFISLRNDIRNNIPTVDSEKMEVSSDGISDADDDNISDGFSGNEKTSDSESIASTTSSKTKRKRFSNEQGGSRLQSSSFQSGTSADNSRQKYVQSETRAKKPSQQEDPNTEVLKVISKRLSGKSAAATAARENDRRDEDEDFGKMLTTELKGLPKALKFKLKHDIKTF